MSKEPLLFLCHRIPFPPNKGDKIRSFNILKLLNEKFDVYLACFIDDPFDRRYIEELQNYCYQAYCLEQHKTVAKFKGLKAFFTGKPITLPYYYDGKMTKWIDDTINTLGINKVFVYSSSMAQYVEGEKYQTMSRIIDFVDVDSDKWRQYAEKKSGIAKWVFNREFRKLAVYEDLICQQFDHSLFVSPDEAALFRQRQQDKDRHKVAGILNGVDISFFDPDAEFTNDPLVPKGPFISFTGAMDYWANVDAVVWFVEQVWPKIQSEQPDVKFVIAGGNPTPEVKALEQRKNIIVTGRVKDVRPFIKQAACVVAPLRIARGIQNKVLEAMALDKPIICTSMAMEGINAPTSSNVCIEDDGLLFAEQCLAQLAAQRQKTTISGNRQWIIDNFTWQQTLIPLEKLFESAD